MSGNKSTPISQSIVANIQLGLPATVSKLSSKMRFIDKIAPILKEGGVIRDIDLIDPLTIKASGIATVNKTTEAFGGMLYVAGAVRQDILIDRNSIYETKQDSIVDVDEIDDLDATKKLKFIDIINAYKLLEDIFNNDDRPDLVIVDTPLMLERADSPLSDRIDVINLYERCKKTIENFWHQNKDKIYPFSEYGVKIASVGNKRFGAVVFALSDENIQYVNDKINDEVVGKINIHMNKLKDVGIKRLLKGVLVKRTRTAAFQFDGINKDNRLEPEVLRSMGLTGMHIKAGTYTPPLLVEVMGGVKDWDTQKLDQLAAEIISLTTFDQKKALPISLWYAKYALKPLEAQDNGQNALLKVYKGQVRHMLQSQDLEKVWKEDFDAFEE
ncbi:hypothetical protein SAMN02745120_0086 [Acetoanaerobium noterae]|uniref:NurA domain-containing protein n=1 Tax=Acetoanaerobium noterae TaxID=745369 RepID=A0A1T5DNL9_9FIRM|nr:hypothetical protein [Acetoanaerobium noterae]SKB73063.1 hypothetical protein SAMN02745120_0086 [Acetoanaerobium noterae]